MGKGNGSVHVRVYGGISKRNVKGSIIPCELKEQIREEICGNGPPKFTVPFLPQLPNSYSLPPTPSNGLFVLYPSNSHCLLLTPLPNQTGYKGTQSPIENLSILIRRPMRVHYSPSYYFWTEHQIFGHTSEAYKMCSYSHHVPPTHMGHNTTKSMQSQLTSRSSHNLSPKRT